MKTLLWLDDLRNPYINTEQKVPIGYDIIEWVKNFGEFVHYIKQNGLPDCISFDHDLGDDVEQCNVEILSSWFNIDENREYTGMDCAKFIIDYCLDNSVNMVKYNIHSANPSGAKNIQSLLDNFVKQVKFNEVSAHKFQVEYWTDEIINDKISNDGSWEKCMNLYVKKHMDILFDEIKHGDDEHVQWLKDKIEDYKNKLI